MQNDYTYASITQKKARQVRILLFKDLKLNSDLIETYDILLYNGHSSMAWFLKLNMQVHKPEFVPKKSPHILHFVKASTKMAYLLLHITSTSLTVTSLVIKGNCTFFKQNELTGDDLVLKTQYILQSFNRIVLWIIQNMIAVLSQPVP